MVGVYKSNVALLSCQECMELLANSLDVTAYTICCNTRKINDPFLTTHLSHCFCDHLIEGGCGIDVLRLTYNHK